MNSIDPFRRLRGFRESGKNQWLACCPGHEDKKASLSISIGNDGRILLHDHAGCSNDAILQALGLTTKDLFPAKGNGNGHSDKQIEAVYGYLDITGNLSFQVVRFSPKDFRQRQPDGKGGFIWNIKGLKPLPYNLPELLRAVYVFIVEGEKDVESLHKVGLTGTCNAGGAGKWPAELNQYFGQEHHITIIPDNDEPGRKHAELVAGSLYGKVASIKILYLPGLPEKGDVSDWLKGRDPEAAAEELSRLSEAAPEWNPPKDEPPKAFSLDDFVMNAEVDAMEAQMLEDKYVLGRMALLGQSTVFYSKPNAGKTLITIWLLTKSIERREIDGNDVFYVNADDSHKGLVHKLKIATIHGFKVLAPGYKNFKAEHLPLYLKSLIDSDTAQGKILILDTVKKFTDLMKKDRVSTFSEVVRQFILHGGTVIMLAHVNKHRDDDNKVVYSGTTDLVDDGDCAYTLDIVTEDATTGQRTVMFENFKSRGDVARQAVYRYNYSDSASYFERLSSVVEVGQQEREAAEKQRRLDKTLAVNRLAVDAIKDCLREGINQKTVLINEAHERSGLSKKQIIKALDDHTGNDVAEYQFWHINRMDRNTHVYQINYGVF